MLKSKKGQIGETISWVVATLVVVGILVFFIYVSILTSKTKNIGITNLKSDIAKEPELLIQKTAFSHQLANDKNKETIDAILEETNS